jgi:ubiquinone/menaquinone biosynthesis C-methylase UbiE
MVNKIILKHWQEQSQKGDVSGTVDLIADELEQKAIIEEIKGNEIILEVGCGDGRNSINIRKTFKDVSIDAFDFSSDMISLARKNARNRGVNNIEFFVFDIDNLDCLQKKYDLVISKRSLINLDDYARQISAINSIADKLKDNGRFVMCENSIDGLTSINKTRSLLGLPEILVPWHNRYFDEDRLEEEIESLVLLKKNRFSSLYYFLSRIVNAYNSKENGALPDYDSPINKIALAMDSVGSGKYAQGVLWVWVKHQHLVKGP